MNGSKIRMELEIKTEVAEVKQNADEIRSKIEDDIQLLLPYAYTHRIIRRGGTEGDTEELLKGIIKDTKVPSEKYEGS